MTRINCGIPVEELENKHLVAEHREITRIPNAIKSGKAKVKEVPAEFRLGAGHVKFFYDKLKYLKRRYLLLYLECRRRGYDVTNKMDAFMDLPEHLMNDYAPTDKDRAIVRERIAIRLKEAADKKKRKMEEGYEDATVA